MDLLKTPLGKKKTLINTYFSRIHTLKASDAFLLKLSFLACAVFLALIIIEFSTAHTVKISTVGGTYSEGILGTPRFVNPVLAVTRTDKDLSTLIYDGLMILGPNGELVPNIAESVTISEDGLTYNIILKQNVQFHDGEALTARDVAFTVNRIQDPLLTSPLRSNFDGIVIEEVNEFEMNFVLPEAYSPFIENLIFGVLPEHIWKDASPEEFPFSQYNNEPVGSGPYHVSKIIRNASGIAETYILSSNQQYHLGAPKIDTFELRFYQTEEKLQSAFKKGIVESVVGVDPTRIQAYELSEETHHLERIPLPRTFALFFNQNKNTALRDVAARAALNHVIDRETLVREVLSGYGNALSSPIPPGFGINVTSTTTFGDVDGARDILKKGGWKFNLDENLWQKEIDKNTVSLTFTIATVNSSVFEATAEFLRSRWEELGVPVTIKQFEQTDLTQAIIRPRDYEALLFGTQLGRPLDYYSFWHSSQRNDPGLNISLYANITTDSILSAMRRNKLTEERSEAVERFVAEIAKEIPAIFLYAPELLYIFPDRIHEASFTGVGEPHERFMRVHEWYIETESVWPFFTNSQDDSA